MTSPSSAPAPASTPATEDGPEEPRKLPPIVERLQSGQKLPICVLLVGMAGSGKTSLLTRLQQSLLDRNTNATALSEHQPLHSSQDLSTTTSPNPSHLETNQKPAAIASQPASPPLYHEEDGATCYCINLDPATLTVPYDVALDIRDTVNYKEVMRQHKLGPNGAIMTSLNLFATKFDQVIHILEKRAFPTILQPGDSAANDHSTEPQHEQEQQQPEPMDYILVDTPGQIEAFTWSASGSIMSEALASSFPTVLCYVVDTARCAASPNTFMSNMLYACSMLYRTRLPLVVCFNKTDVVSHDFCMEWMRDYETFQQALDDTAETSGFYGSLTRSMSLVLDEFYSNFVNACGVSAVTGAGMDEFWKMVQKAGRVDFPNDYIDDLMCRIEEQEAKKRAMARSSVRRLQRDLD